MNVQRTLAALALGLAVCAGPGAALAAYPDKAITLVVTYPPGGTVDAVARMLGPRLAAELGQSVIIENRGGAGGMIGGSAVARAKPDGYTLMLDASNHAQNPAVQSRMSFDTLADFAPVSLLLRVPNVLVTTPNSPIRTVDDVIQGGRQASGGLMYASSGPGSAQHLAGELFNHLAKTKLEHVAYKGGGPAMVDVMAGQVPIMFASMGSSWTHVQSGKLRAIAVTGAARSPAAPELPTLAESGVPGYDAYEWNAVFAPAGTPLEIVEQLSQALAKVVNSPEMRKQLEAIGAEPMGSTPEELDTFRRAEIEKWKTLVQQAGLQTN